MGEENFFVWRDEYPESFRYPGTDNLPVSRYKQIVKGYTEHLEENFQHIEQEGNPRKLLNQAGEDKNNLIYNFDKKSLETALSAVSENWFGKIIDRNIPEYKIPGDAVGHLEAHMLAAEGTKKAVETASETGGTVFHNGGGHHHAHKGGSSDIAFNMINDEAAGIEYLKDVEDDPQILVVDLDLHFGDGTVSIYGDDPDVYHLSVHEWNLFPNVNSGWLDYTGSSKAEGTKVNLPLPENVGGEKYLSALEEILPPLIEESDPDLVMYQAGVDPYKEDDLGSLNLTLEDLYQRDRKVVEQSGDTPLVTVTGGGYSSSAGKASINTLAAMAGEDIVYRDNGLTEDQLQDAAEAEEKTDQRLGQLLEQESLRFLN